MNDQPPIKVIYEPTVYLLGRQQINDRGLNDFLEDNGVLGWETDTEEAGEYLIETAGRLCYMSFAKPRPGGNNAYIGHILEVGHGSVLEHAVFNLIITGVSRSFTHELVRHRAGWGFSQLSQRYVDETGCGFVVPPSLVDAVKQAQHYIKGKGGNIDVALWNARHDESPSSLLAGLTWLAFTLNASAAYSLLSGYLSGRDGESGNPTALRKQAREAARSVLPNATETKIFVTANARALRHFIEMRASLDADAEMRNVAMAILALLKRESPNVFSDFDILTSNDGRNYARSKYHKV